MLDIDRKTSEADMRSYCRSIAAEKNIFNNAAITLVGIVQGILCDGNLKNEEIKYLDS